MEEKWDKKKVRGLLAILKSQPGAQHALWEVVQNALEREWMGG